jgi:ATP-binding cassette subfamily B protein
VSAERIDNILNTVPRIADTIDTVHKTTFDSEIDFKTLGVKILKGKKIAIIGAIGSGKSQLARKLMHLRELETAEILIDGVDLKNINLEDLRRLINMVPQENFLFSTSIKENISYAKDLSDLEIEALAKAVGIHDEIMRFENGYETIVGERGITLSGGQRQRIAIARALAINPEVLILDDSLSSVDNAIASTILTNINKLRMGKTTIFITHKPQIAELCDEVFVMENGKLTLRLGK